MRFLLPGILMSAALLVAPAWAIDPAKDPAKGLNFFSEKDERAMGEKSACELDGKLRLIRDPSIQGQVERIGARLAARAPRQVAFRWSVVDTKEVNAFAAPGGFVYDPPSADRIGRLRPGLPPADAVQLASAGEFGFLKAHLQGMLAPPREQDVKLSAAVAALGRAPAGAAAASLPAESMPEDSQEIVAPGNTVWLNTRVTVQPADEIVIAASGEIQPVKNSDLTCGPDGVPGMTKGWLKPISSAPTGARVVRVTGNGKPMLAVAVARLEAPLAGPVELGINDGNNFDNRGEVRVVLAVRRR